jgi:hypothetical protein
VDATDPKTDPTVNKALGSSLFMSYSTITEEEDACSNEWYHRWAISDEYKNNLLLQWIFSSARIRQILSGKSGSA